MMQEAPQAVGIKEKHNNHQAKKNRLPHDLEKA